ncbi:MAG: hypothetical protein ABIQ22_15825 [Arthrobacter oryzae]
MKRILYGLERRVQALIGQLRMDLMAGWGADIFSLALDPRARPAANVAGWNLAAHGIEMLQHLIAGPQPHHCHRVQV